ncbi:hypothetical protein [Clostridium sp. Marseille-QA1073]
MIIEYSLQFLNKEDQNFLKLKYEGGKNDWQVGNELGMSQPTAYRIRQKLIENISRWEEWIKS